MSQPENDWQDLQQAWQSYQPDMKLIKKKINWVTWRMIFVLTIEVIFVAGYFGFLVYSANYKQNSLSVDVWNYFIGLFAVVGLFIDFKLRLPLMRLQGDTTKDILNLYLQRTHMGISLGLWCKYFSWLLLVSFNLWVMMSYLYFPEQVRLYRAEFILFGNVFISGSVLASYWYQHKKHKEYLKLKDLWQDYLG